MNLRRKVFNVFLIFFAVIVVACEDYGDAIDRNENIVSFSSKVGTYQAEDRTFQSGCSEMSNHSGYTGSGFMDYGSNGSMVEWNNVNVPSAGQYELAFRYANGSGGDRRSLVTINDVNGAGNVAFPKTGAWTKWSSASITVNLQAGNNQIRVTANTSKGGPNLDRMDVLSPDGGEGVTNGCALVNEGYSATLSCPGGGVITSIEFASYGTPIGSCSAGFLESSCTASSSRSELATSCLNKKSCTVDAKNSVFGDPCPGTYKKLVVMYTCVSGGDDEPCERCLDFNTNNFASDTEGDLPGTVLFVQSSVMPSKNTVSGDIQPRLVSLRKTMVLFDPANSITGDDPVHMTVRSPGAFPSEFSVDMDRPEELTDIAGYEGNISLTPDDFTIPAAYDYTISGQTQLNKFKNDTAGIEMQNLFAIHDVINIKTWDGSWIRDLFLPDGEVFNGKKLVFSSNASYTSNVFYGARSLIVRRNNEFVFINKGGTWYADIDLDIIGIRYGSNFWSAKVPLQYITPGMKIQFSHGPNSGTISNVDVGGYTELIIHTIDLGMLTPYQDKYKFQKNPELQRQYFQTIPVSRMIVTEYEPQHLLEVMLPDGTLLTDHEPSEGGVYSGRMRGIGKTLISHGIDNANYGINSSAGVGEGSHPFHAAQLTAHMSVGNYTNGRVVHGLSGGNGMVTLTNTTGNEWSHELGHNYGLGHYPGGFSGSVHRTADQVNSTWGWDSDKDFFIPNFTLAPSSDSTCLDETCQAPFSGHKFGTDAMAGGYPHIPSANQYTMHTPYVLNIIQKFFEKKLIFTLKYPTGLARWDETEKCMKSTSYEVPLTSGTDKVDARPSKIGVPVTTLLGFYDPQEQLTSYIYPAFHGSYGVVYKHNDNIRKEPVCYLKVETADGGSTNIPLRSARVDANNMNKFHVNVETALNPSSATVICSGNELAARTLEPPSRNLVFTEYGAKSALD